MKWVVGILIVAMLVLTACGNKEVVLDDTQQQETPPAEDANAPAEDLPLAPVVDDTTVIEDTEETDPLADW